ncbi:MAG: aminopeptidase [Elusimicrobiota bacterium]
MFTPAQLERYADTLLWGITTARPSFRKGESVLIRFDVSALPLAEAVHRKTLERGWNPVLRLQPTPAMEKDFFTLGGSEQRRFVPGGEKELFESLQGLIALRGPASLTHLKSVDAGRIKETTLARKPYRDIFDRSEEKGRFGWTLCTYPTEELARQAGLTLKAYAEQVVKACFLDDKDPAKRWRDIHRDVMGIKKWLQSLKIRTLRVESRSMDLEVKLGERRRFLGISGHNIPSFEVFTSPDWRGTRGVYYSDLPSFRNGNYVKGVRIEFKNGSAAKVSAKQGEDFVRKTLATDPGAGRLGEFSLTDVRFSRIDRFMADTLFDENFGGRHGNCHVAVGNSYSDTFDGDPARLTKALKTRLGYNESALHWDLVNTEDKRVSAVTTGGKRVLVYEKGRFAC